MEKQKRVLNVHHNPARLLCNKNRIKKQIGRQDTALGKHKEKYADWKTGTRMKTQVQKIYICM